MVQLCLCPRQGSGERQVEGINAINHTNQDLIFKSCCRETAGWKASFASCDARSSKRQVWNFCRWCSFENPGQKGYAAPSTLLETHLAGGKFSGPKILGIRRGLSTSSCSILPSSGSSSDSSISTLDHEFNYSPWYLTVSMASSGSCKDRVVGII